MSVADFYDMIPKHFFNKLNGFFELEQMRERNEWERCRWQTCYLLNIQIAKGKKLKLKLIPGCKLPYIFSLWKAFTPKANPVS